MPNPSKQLWKSRADENAAAALLIRVTSGNVRFRIFAMLWAVATLFHMAHSSIFDRQLNLALLTVASFFVIFRPSLASLIILAGLQIFDAAFRMPLSTNHWVFTAFANLTILHVVIFLMTRHRTFRISESDLLKYMAPLIRLELIILYFFAAFHKLNFDFLLSPTSCGTELLRAQGLANILPLSESLLIGNRYLTIIIEFALPLLLCFRSTRNAGIMVGIIFHCILSYSNYNAFYDFSSVVLAVYFLFISADATEALSGLYVRARLKIRSALRIFSITRLVLAGIGVVVAAGLIYRMNLSLNTFRMVHLYFFWTVYSVIFCGLFILYLNSRARRRLNFPRTSRVHAHWTLYAMPFVVLLNGASPYLGLKTENSYAMFSNLRTEGGVTNHLLVPATIQIFDFQKEVVEIGSSTDTLLQRMANEGQAMVLFEFRNYVNDNSPDSVVYRINGRPGIFLEGDKRSQAALGQNPYILRKLLKFRSFSPTGPQKCNH